MAGKALKLSGNISVSPTDPEQKAIILTLELYSDDGKQLCATQAFEKGTTSKYHELMLDITPGAGYARVTIEIRKQGDTNIFSFSDLRLEVTERQPDDNASAGRIIPRSRGRSEGAPEVPGRSLRRLRKRPAVPGRTLPAGPMDPEQPYPAMNQVKIPETCRKKNRNINAPLLSISTYRSP